MYSALVSPLEHRVVVVCGKKTTVAEVVATALAKCGKQDLDPKRYELVDYCDRVVVEAVINSSMYFQSGDLTLNRVSLNGHNFIVPLVDHENYRERPSDNVLKS